MQVVASRPSSTRRRDEGEGEERKEGRKEGSKEARKQGSKEARKKKKKKKKKKGGVSILTSLLSTAYFPMNVPGAHDVSWFPSLSPSKAVESVRGTDAEAFALAC